MPLDIYMSDIQYLYWVPERGLRRDVKLNYSTWPQVCSFIKETLIFTKWGYGNITVRVHRGMKGYICGKFNCYLTNNLTSGHPN